MWLFLTLTELYPSRLDLATLCICADGDATDKSVNYLQLGPTTQDALDFIIHVWKTQRSSVTGERVLAPPPGEAAHRQHAEIQRIVKAYLFVTDKEADNPVFQCSKTGGPITRSAMGKRVTAFFAQVFPGTKVGMTVLRKVFLTEELDAVVAQIMAEPGGDHAEALAKIEALKHIHGHTTQRPYIKKRKRDDTEEVIALRAENADLKEQLQRMRDQQR
jgi:hypothetical protein